MLPNKDPNILSILKKVSQYHLGSLLLYLSFKITEFMVLFALLRNAFGFLKSAFLLSVNSFTLLFQNGVSFDLY